MGEKGINFHVAWQVSTGADDNQQMTLVGDTLYVSERYNQGIASINVVTGKLNWRVQGYYNLQTGPIVLGDNVFAFVRDSPQIFWVKTDGTLVGVIDLPDDGYQNRAFKFDGDGSRRMFWQTYDYGLAMVDVGDLTPSKKVILQHYTVTPTLVFPDTRAWLMSGVMYRDERIYFGVSHKAVWDPIQGIGVRNPDDNYYCYDLAAKKILWTWVPQKFVACEPYAFHWLGEDLVVVDALGMAILNEDIGIPLIENTTELKISDPGPFLYEGKFYYTNQRWGDPELEPNVLCRDAHTGKLVWAIWTKGYSLGSSPAVYNGIVYVAAQNDVRMFNAANGDFLGSSDKLRGGAAQLVRTPVYKDLMINLDTANQVIYGLKMDYKLDSSGKLYR